MKKVQDIKVYDAGDGFTVMVSVDKREGARTAVIYQSNNPFTAQRILQMPIDECKEQRFMELVEMALPDYKYQVLPDWIRMEDESRWAAEDAIEVQREAAKEASRGTILLGRKKDNIADESESE